MKRRSFLRAATFSLPIAVHQSAWPQGTANGEAAIPESSRRIARAASAALSMERRDWEQGILAQAFLDAGDRERVILLTRAAMVQQAPDGRMAVVLSGGPTDPAMGGPAYAQAAKWTGEPAMQDAVAKMLEWIRHKAPRNAQGILYHTFGAPEMWSDGLNGAPPFLASMGYYDEALAQIEGYRKLLWNPQARLLAHIWDDGKQQFKDPQFWGGGNGWAAAGLARVIRSLPPERRADREHLAEFAREIIGGCMAHQRTDGLFHDVVDHPSTFVETDLAQMLAFATYEGVHAGWLDAGYRAKADRLRSAARAKMDEFGFVQGACSAPDFDRPGISTEAQAFCILMEAAGARVDAIRAD